MSKHTRIVQTVQGVNEKSRTSITYVTRPMERTIQTLRAHLPFPGKFFMELERKLEASFTDKWGATVTIKLSEVDKNERGK